MGTEVSEIFSKRNILPSLDHLQRWSLETSLGRSTNKLAITPDVLEIVRSDALVYLEQMEDDEDINRLCYRVKSPASINTKVERHAGLRFQSIFNDLLGIRIRCDEYPDTYPDYYRVADLRNGKSCDDGYRAVHLYYRMSNYHYTIEVQLWSDNDYDFNSWMHATSYKYTDPSVTKYLRELYDAGFIQNEEGFRRELMLHV